MNKQRLISATRILPLKGSLPEEPVLVFEGDHLVEISSKNQLTDGARIEEYNGTLVPGFVNTHCHLELSHMKDKIGPGTGLTQFLRGVVTHPPVPEEEVLEAIHLADREMWESGIVAVGDISNKSVTADVKSASSMSYYTFVEMFDFFNPAHADRFFDQYSEVYDFFRDYGLEAVSRVPHSPYTVSRKLEQKLSETVEAGVVGSIHMLENDEESWLLDGKPSEYYDFFAAVDFPLDHFIAPGYGSMEKFLNSGYRPDRMLFVHNTVAGKMDLELMKQFSEYGQPYLATCPNANLYIESRLPDYKVWVASGIPITIGTDSYSSNHQLSIWNEICTIKANFEGVSWEELFQWASLNGARALGMEDQFGSFEVGKKPGAVLLEHHTDTGVNENSVLRRIV